MFKKVISTIVIVLMVMTVPAFAMEKPESTESNRKVLYSYSMEEMRGNPNVTFGNDHDIKPLASEDGYISTLSMNANSWHCGATRSYSNDYFKCIVGDTSSMEFYGQYAELDVEVGESSWFDYNTLGSATINFTQNGQSRTAYLGKAGRGRRAFAFRTYTSPIESGNVEMRSY